jgi:serine protease inhibitor
LKWDLDGTAAGVVNAMTIKLPWSARSDMLPATDHEASIMIDEPFVVFITDRKTKTNLFIGVVNDPR